MSVISRLRGGGGKEREWDQRQGDVECWILIVEGGGQERWM